MSKTLRCAVYVRVSTTEDQTTANQLLPLREFCASRGWRITREYEDKASAADLRGRIAWRDLMADAERGRFDVLLVWKLDRAFRSTLHAADSLNRLQGYGVAVKSLTEEWADSTTPAGSLMRTILIAFAGFEREQIRERTRAGLRRARSQGKVIGRPHRLNGEFEAVRSDVLAGTISQREAARRLKVSPRTIARALRHNGGQFDPSPSPVNQGFSEAAGGD